MVRDIDYLCTDLLFFSFPLQGVGYEVKSNVATERGDSVGNRTKNVGFGHPP